MRQRLFSIAKALDAFLFSLFTLGGSRDGEYASSSAWNQRRKGRLHGDVSVWLLDAVFAALGDRDHCARSWHGQQHLYQPSAKGLP